jgi:LuxR family transcriptional regulator, quorum-sensing system regulator CciR
MAVELPIIERLLAAIKATDTMANLQNELVNATHALGFSYFALTHHAHPSQWPSLAIALHNCPAEWVESYSVNKLYKIDPILHASTLTTIGFRWNELPTLVEMTPDRQKLLHIYANAGVAAGMTIPVHIPGEPTGSCSFATRTGQLFPDDNVIAAQMIGAFAFQAARKIAGLTRSFKATNRALTPRQRDCLLWAMRGKSDWEIGQILELSPDTVKQHIDMARSRYGVAKRVQLAIRAIYLGDIRFDEVIF